MKHRRKFRIELKRQVVEELLSGVSTPAQLTRRYEISSGLLHRWNEQYARGRFDNEPSKEAALEDRVRQLEQLVGRLTLENEFLIICGYFSFSYKTIINNTMSSNTQEKVVINKNQDDDYRWKVWLRSAIQKLIFQICYSLLVASTIGKNASIFDPSN